MSWWPGKAFGVAQPNRWLSVSVIDPEQALDLLELVQVGFRHFAIGGQNHQVMGEHRGVVPVEAAFDDRRIVDDAVLGMNRRIRYRVISCP
jgi:hypothetical protein